MAASPPPRQPIPVLSRLDLVLDTARLRLRPFTEADLDDVWPALSDPAFSRHMSWTAHADRAESRAWIAAMNREFEDNKSVSWAIEHDGKVVGNIALLGVTFQMRALRVDRAELGYWVVPDAAGSGIATEAATAVIRCAFDAIGLHKVTVGCFVDNVASQRVIEKLGFRFVGRQEDDVWRDGAWHAHLRYELTSSDWPDVSTTTRIDRRTLRA